MARCLAERCSAVIGLVGISGLLAARVRASDPVRTN
jgi:hypothetical protein